MSLLDRSGKHASDKQVIRLLMSDIEANRTRLAATALGISLSEFVRAATRMYCDYTLAPLSTNRYKDKVSDD